MPSPRPKEAILPSASGGIAIAFLGSEGFALRGTRAPAHCRQPAASRRQPWSGRRSIRPAGDRLTDRRPFRDDRATFPVTQAELRIPARAVEIGGCRRSLPVLGIFADTVKTPSSPDLREDGRQRKPISLRSSPDS